ncbi:MAG: AMP-binding protein, partial [bacterium]|nr:AMP-binding protein [bacterium]
LTYKKLSAEELVQLKQEYPLLEDIYTLSPMQEGMFFHHLLDPESPAYFEQAFFRIGGEMQIPHVEKSLQELVKRHDILRTTFIRTHSERLLQVVLKERKIDFLYEDITGRAGKKEHIEQYKETDKKRGFHLGKDVLMRVTIFKTGAAEYEFALSFHHIAIDGWCLAILITEFFMIYRGYVRNGTYRLPGVKQYKTYIRWLEKQDKESSKNYWKNYLNGYEEAALIPGKKEHGTGEIRFQKKDAELRLSRETTGALNRLAVSVNATGNTIIQMIWGILLGKYNRKRDVLFGAVVSGRPPELDGIETMVGLFLNTIPVRVKYLKGTAATGILATLREEAMETGPHHYYPLAQIQSQSILKQNLLDHILVFENAPFAENLSETMTEERNEVSDVQFQISNTHIFRQNNYGFSIIIVPGEQMTVTIEYNANEYEGGFIKRITKHFEHVLSQILEKPGQPVDTLSLLTGAEKQQVLYEFNETEERYPAHKTIHEIFMEQAAKTPGNTAVKGEVWEEYAVKARRSTITYGELDRQSNQLAARLLSRGITPSSIVAIVADTSVEKIIGILGILKTGSAYLPIAPDAPKSRVDYMLKDSNARALVTTLETKEEENIGTGDLLEVTPGKPVDAAWQGERLSIVGRFSEEPEVAEAQAVTSVTSVTTQPVIPDPKRENTLVYVIYTSGS